jgi:hypothetical protein
VRVKSCLGDALTGSLNTFWSIPKFVTETVGFIHNGPIRTRTFAGSGPPSGDCADAGTAAPNATAKTPAKQALRDNARRGFTSTAIGSFERPLKRLASVHIDTDGVVPGLIDGGRGAREAIASCDTDWCAGFPALSPRR